MGRRRIVLLVLGVVVVCPLFGGTVLVQRRAAQERMEVREVLERLEIERIKAEAARTVSTTFSIASVRQEQPTARRTSPPSSSRPRRPELGGGHGPHANIAIAFGGQNSAMTLRQGPTNNVPRLAGDT
jgi:hypothetical protein